jgi:curli biogenesis system outer membrane secretion channel CsgG
MRVAAASKGFRPHLAVAIWVLAAPAMCLGQTGSPVASKPAIQTAAPKPATPVDKVIEMAKLGVSEDLMIQAIVNDNKKVNLGADDILRLKQAGVSDRVIRAMADPAAASTAAPLSVAGTPVPKAHLRAAFIDEFDWATVRTFVNQIFGFNEDIGKGIRALLTNRVLKSGTMRLVERAKLSDAEREQELGQSNRVKKGSGARIGQLQGANAILMGDVTVFGFDNTKQGFSLCDFGFRGSLCGLGFGQKEDKAVITINYRLVDVETGEIIASDQAHGESSRKSKGFAGMLALPGGAARGAGSMTSSDFVQTIIGEATIAACDALAAMMEKTVPALPLRPIEARVALVSGQFLTITAGTDDGVEVGDQFEVFRILGEIKDPVTGEVLDNRVEKTGDMVIMELRLNNAVGQYRGTPVSTKDGLVRKRLQ